MRQHAARKRRYPRDYLTCLPAVGKRRQQLVEQLYSYDKGVTHNAIEVYVHRLRKKIAGAGVTVKTQYGRGYVLDYVNH